MNLETHCNNYLRVKDEECSHRSLIKCEEPLHKITNKVSNQTNVSQLWPPYVLKTMKRVENTESTPCTCLK